ncbi:hypothetical protein NL676_022967 [Syzygium grande]|nr:hypothetical protein NL676_022967 [Syzygium grande]
MAASFKTNGAPISEPPPPREMSVLPLPRPRNCRPHRREGPPGLRRVAARKPLSADTRGGGGGRRVRRSESFAE